MEREDYRVLFQEADDEIRRILIHLEMAAYLARPHGVCRRPTPSAFASATWVSRGFGGIRMEVEEAREKLKRLREMIRAGMRDESFPGRQPGRDLPQPLGGDEAL